MKKIFFTLIVTLFYSASVFSEDRYFVFANGNWYDTLNWSTTSGGAGGASVPTFTDNVFFDGSSFTAINQFVDVSGGIAECDTMDWTGIPFIVALRGDAGAEIHIYGSAVFNDSINITEPFQELRSTFYFNSIVGNTITSNGFSFSTLTTVHFDGIGGSWSLLDPFVSSSDVFLDRGELITDNFNFSAYSFWSNNVNIRSLQLGSSTVSISNTWNLSTTTNLTFDGGTSTILFQAGSGNFKGGGLTYNIIKISNISNMSIYGSNSYKKFFATTNSAFSGSLTLKLEANSTQTILDTLFLQGTSIAKKLNLQSLTLGTQGNFSKSIGKVCCDFLNIMDNNAGGGAAFFAGATSIQGPNVTGWVFSACPPPLTITLSKTDINCNGACTGTATVTAIPGVPPYTYSWSDGSTTSTITGLCAGIYSVTVMDAEPDTAFGSITITQSSPLTASISSFTNASCKDVCDGQATVTASGGTSPYTYSWNTVPVQTSSTATGLCDGTYTVTVTDAKACTATVSAVITEPALLTVTIPPPTNVSCFNVCDGRSIAVAAGGTTPYSFDWDDPGNQQNDTASGLCDGTYNVLVTDAKGCLKSASVTITEPAQITISITFASNITCAGKCNGVAVSSASNGTAPYTFLWNNGEKTATADSLCASINTVTVTDANGCTSTADTTLTQPPPLSSTVSTVINVTCFGSCNGSATVNPTGGTGAYTYSWSGGGCTTCQTNVILCAITYTITVTDNNNCTTTNSAVITQPSVLTADIVNSTNANCFGACSGTAVVQANGGIPPYTFNWSNLQTNDTASGLCAGFYSVTVTDNNGCDTTDTISIVEPTVIVTSAQVSCSGFCDGVAIATPSGGTPPYTFQWYDSIPWVLKPGETDSILDTLCTGTYCVVTTDNNGCLDTICITIELPSITTTDTLPSCPGDCDGKIVVTAVGGNPPYTYEWRDIFGIVLDTDSVLDNACAGKYYIRITNSEGCVLLDSVMLFDPSALSTAISSTTPPLCFGQCNGSAEVTASGGTPPYTFLWNTIPPQTTSIATGLCNGNSTVTVTDGSGCTVAATATITQPAAVNVVFTTIINVTCGGACNGTITATGSGGTPPYSYNWSNGFTTGSINNLCPSTYKITITDNNGCFDIDSVTITEPSVIILTMSQTDDSCFNSCTGAATATAVGGTIPYTYEWNDPLFQSTLTASGLCAGNYTVTVTDFNGCSKTASITITQPALLTAFITSSVNPFCGGDCNGQATVSPGGGTLPYTYNWSQGAQTTALAINLCTGTHTVTVTDLNGCSATASVILIAPPVLTATITDSTPVTCNGLCDGDATVTAGGGSPLYTYLWSAGGQTGTFATALCAATHTVTVTDSKGCTTTRNVIITQPLVLSVTVTAPAASCGGVCDVIATASASGGNIPYSYLWNDPASQSNSTATGLCDGSVTVTVTDFKGCTATGTFVITEPAILLIDTIAVTSVGCSGACTGQAEVFASGGTPGYTFLWNNNDTGPVADSLCSQVYSVTVTDNKGCTASMNIPVSGPGGLSAFIEFQTDASCFNVCDGSAELKATGGVPPYTYQWKDGSGAPIGTNDTLITGLCDGKYEADVLDNNGCLTKTDTAIISEPALFTAAIGSFGNTLCFDSCDGSATVSLTGGASPFTYSWSNGFSVSSATGLCAGNYTITVTDASGCTATTSIAITEPGVFALIFTNTDPSCNGLCDGQSTVTVSGGTSPYTYIWSNNNTGSAASLLCAGTVSVTITDINSCPAISSTVIANPTAIQLTVVDTTSSTCTACNGDGTVSGSGGTPPYTFTWSTGNVFTGVASSTEDSLCISTYSVTLTDSKGCSVQMNVVVSGPGNLISTIADIAHETCPGACDGGALASTSGGVSPYIYVWKDGLGNTILTGIDTIGNLCPGNYTAEITDNSTCLTTVPFTINAASLMIFTDTTVSNVTCFGKCDGSISAIHTPGTPPYTYTWFPGNTITQTPDTSGVCPGMYGLQVEDINGCLATLANISVTEPAQLNLSVSSVNETCSGDCDGSAIATASGGVTPYTYSWSTGATNSSISALCAATYYITLTDNNGCSLTDSAIVNDPGPVAIDSFTTISPGCKDSCDGSTTVNPSGGSGSYAYAWSVPGTDQIISGLCAGTYSITVTDNLGCGNITGDTTITEPAAIGINISTVNVICGGQCTGQATVNAGGGTPPYTFLWSNASDTTQTITGLCTGLYTVTVTDLNGCTGTKSKNVTENLPLILTLVDTTSTSCNTCDGVAQVIANGGVPPYSYTWDIAAGSQTTETATGLCASTYTVTVTDDSICTDVLTVVVTGPNGFMVQLLDTTDVSCFGACDGGAVVSVSGGFPPYTHQWYDLTTMLLLPGETNDTITGLCAGNYSDTINDNSGCTTSVSITITEPAQFTASITDSTDITCFGNCNGSATVTATGGVLPYTYQWSNLATGSVVTGLCFGTYTVTVSSTGGCGSLILTVTFDEPPQMVLSLLAVTNVTCYGNCNGSIATGVSGGVAPYTYTWSPAAASSSDTLADSLCAAIYRITVTDANGCQAMDSATVTEPPLFSVSITDSSMVSCNGMNDGFATVSVTGGLGSLTYLWNNGDTSLTTDSLLGGVFCITVTDSTGCQKIRCITIVEPAVLSAAIINIVNVTCNGAPSGSATASVTGGTIPFAYEWSHGDLDSVAGNIFAGEYYVTVTDLNGCTDSVSVTITDSSAMTLTVIDQDNIKCKGFCNGSIEVNATLSIVPYTYQWDNGDTDSVASGLCAGTYNLTVTSSSNCVRVKPFTITAPDSILIHSITNIINTLCATACVGSATSVVSGGVPPYSFLWDDGDTLLTDTALCAGKHFITITDSAGCAVADSVTILGSSPISLTFDTTTATCNNTNDGAVDISVSGGKMPYIFIWSTGETTEDLAAISSGNYSVTVSDSVNCTANDSFIVAAGITLIASAGVDLYVCEKDTAFLMGFSNIQGVTYTWYALPDAVTTIGTDSAIKVAPADTTSYMFVISKNGCNDRDTLTVFTYAVPLPDATAQDTILLKGYSTQLSSSGIGSFVWFPSATLTNFYTATPVATPEQTTTYTVLVTSASGCKGTDSIRVQVLDQFVVPNGITPNGDGKNDVWEIPLIETYPNVSVEIFNRWGEQIFESPDGNKYANKFDGKYKGKNLPAGSYYFIIDFGMETMKPITGTVTIMQ